MIDADCLQTHGYVRIDAAIESQLIQSVLASAQKAFDLSPDIKAKYLRSNGGYGYTPPGIERVVGNVPDPNREFWDIGQGSPNLFPDEVGEFGNSAIKLHAQLMELAYDALRGLDRSWGTTIAPLVLDSRMPMRVSKYREAPEGEILFPRHRDFSLITLFAGSDNQGVEFECQGRWFRPDQPSGSVLVGAGTLLKQYRPQLKPLPHRIVAVPGNRTSIVLFTEPRPEVRLPNGQSTSDYISALMARVRQE
ncbi:isopenicillin N synthase family oxygenase [Candidatus Uhrbacteria bacterium]|nr:isopenicillin N synthase family oxygenase [Candidatus Uhrbacteria bacterium]